MELYTDLLRARVGHLCDEYNIPRPKIYVQSSVPIVTADVIQCPELQSDCPADHRVMAWQIARIWWGVTMAGRPFWQQVEMSHMDIILEA
jgi:hypothetical protein